jgi:tight adherence protein B
VIAAADPDALTALFEREAAELSRQMLVTAPLPAEFSDVEGSVAVSVDAGGETYSDSAFVSLGSVVPKEAEQEVAGPRTVEVPSPLTSTKALLVGLGALGLGLLVVLLGALGVLGKRDNTSVEDQIAAYTRAGSPRRTGGGVHGMGPGAAGTSRSVAQSAVGIAEKALEGNSAFESKLGAKLESADVSLKPAEWLLVHSGIAVGAALVGFLLSGGGIVLTLTLLLAGAVLPWMYLGIRKSRRQKAFNSQLAETLQLISGSLSAGLSLSQSLDTVVREGSEPITSEFRRALVEARLGIPVEDTLDNVAKRMESADFEWVVMAIRIQREVGGNLAELLLKVAGTMRERDYLRRQVKTLSAEGKMSAYILGVLPPGMFAYMLMANRDYVSPLYTTPLGWVMLVSAAMLMGVGAFWMSRLVKVDV